MKLWKFSVLYPDLKQNEIKYEILFKLITESKLFVDDADFFSFGTNDLAQYLMAADRTNTSVVDYIPKAIPGILKLIENVCRVAHQKGKWVGICGELASEKSLIKQFINMGVEELSMPPSMIPQVKALIRELE